MLNAGRLHISLVALGLAAALMAACSAAPASKKLPGDPVDYTDPNQDPPLDPPLEAGTTNDDGGFDLGGRESNAGSDAGGGRTDAGSLVIDAGGGTKDAGGPVLCSGPLAAGDVKVVELMIASQSGAGDKGEWIELQSTRQCTLNLKGLRVESPRGTGVDKAEVLADYLVPPNGIVVVTASPSALDNHAVGNVAASFNATDVLKNDGDTVSVYAGVSTLIDTLTYPKFTLFIGRSVAFPWDCAWSDRSSWARWSWSFNKWNGAFQGTPNDDNFDVACY